MDVRKPPPPRRRGAHVDPPNRYESTRREQDLADLEFDEDAHAGDRAVPTTFLPDAAKSILTKNDSPDVGFDYSVNPYRGCEHGCTYCYARPTHEMLGMGAGLDFETRIMVKHDAPRLLREALHKPSWKPAPIVMSGVTDCYQPAERRFRLTRGCLEVLLECRNPALLITKNVLLLRDLDLLREMARRSLVHVRLTVTTLDPVLAASMEPRTPPPAARLEAIRRLRAAGVPVGIMMAPVVPGLTDSEIPALLAAASEAGAQCADYVPLRLPLTVKPIFLDWLERFSPLRAERVKTLIQDMRGGALNDPNFGSRMRGTGAYAAQIEATFGIFARRHGLDGCLPPLDLSRFRRAHAGGMVQGELF